MLVCKVWPTWSAVCGKWRACASWGLHMTICQDFWSFTWSWSLSSTMLSSLYLKELMYSRFFKLDTEKAWFSNFCHCCIAWDRRAANHANCSLPSQKHRLMKSKDQITEVQSMGILAVLAADVSHEELRIANFQRGNALQCFTCTIVCLHWFCILTSGKCWLVWIW